MQVDGAGDLEADRLADWARRAGGEYLPVDVASGHSGVLSAVDGLIGRHWKPFVGQLSLGRLSSPVTLYPLPDPTAYGRPLPSCVSLVAFVPEEDVELVPVSGRHIVLPARAGTVPGDPEREDFRAMLALYVCRFPAAFPRVLPWQLCWPNARFPGDPT